MRYYKNRNIKYQVFTAHNIFCVLLTNMLNITQYNIHTVIYCANRHPAFQIGRNCIQIKKFVMVLSMVGDFVYLLRFIVT